MNARYSVKRLVRPKRYLGWFFHYMGNGDVGLSQSLLIEQTLDAAGMTKCQAKKTPYVDGLAYHTPMADENPYTETKYEQLVGGLRYLEYFTITDLSFIVGRLGAAAAKPTQRH